MRSALLLVLAVSAALPAIAAETDAVKEKAETCFACHGKGGVSPTEGVPSIAAEPSYFTQWQLVFFRSGSLKSDVMGPIAAALENEDIRAFGTYLEGLPSAPPPVGPDPDPDLTKAGAALAVTRHCNTCHAADFHGQQAAARLAGQREEWLVKALQDYKAGRRTGTGVAAMPEAAFSLSEGEIRALAHYLSRLP